MDKVKTIELHKCLDILSGSIDALNDSIQRCTIINLNSIESWDDKNDLESLSARFARTSNIYIQKLLKFVILALKEDDKYVIDRINKAEKIGLITSSEDLIEIRDLRNEIAHEYRPDDIEVLYKDVLKYASVLIENIEITKKFILANPTIFI